MLLGRGEFWVQALGTLHRSVPAGVNSHCYCYCGRSWWWWRRWRPYINEQTELIPARRRRRRSENTRKLIFLLLVIGQPLKPSLSRATTITKKVVMSARQHHQQHTTQGLYANDVPMDMSVKGNVAGRTTTTTWLTTCNAQICISSLQTSSMVSRSDIRFWLGYIPNALDSTGHIYPIRECWF